MRRITTLFVLAIAALIITTASPSMQENLKIKVRNKISLKAYPFDLPMTLVCTFRGSEGRLRSFDILVDGEKLTTQTLEIHPSELFDFEYPLPEQLTRGKNRITVKFQPQPNAGIGSLFDLRVAQLEPK
ncbi:MAG: hypothetical protein L0220_28435 [Acidobacteria bacterium]|nr:hypothetical protein [Acidobacteriota bacterium]